LLYADRHRLSILGQISPFRGHKQRVQVGFQRSPFTLQEKKRKEGHGANRYHVCDLRSCSSRNAWADRLPAVTCGRHIAIREHASHFFSRTAGGVTPLWII